jgi:diguanylate cyclase (GGDEF)-like protein/PAS domain S-box-containing protein
VKAPRSRLVASLGDRLLWPWLFSLFLLFLFHFSSPLSLTRLDLMLHDGLSPEVPLNEADPPLVVGIDEASLNAYGAWPWPRAQHAALIDRLNRADVAGIGYTVMFAEPSRLESGDQSLVEAIARAGNVVLPVAPVARGDGGVSLLMPLPALADVAARLGHVDVELDADALARRVYLQAGVESPRWPALAWALIDVSRRAKPLSSLGARRRADAGVGAVGHWVRDREVIVLPAALTPQHVSAADVLSGRVSDDVLRGRTVLVGVTAVGLGSALATPLSAHAAPMPAVEFHARTYSALRNGWMQTPLAPGWSLLPALTALAALCALRPQCRKHDMALVALLLALPVLCSLALLHGARMWMPPAMASTALGAGALCWLMMQTARLAVRLNRAHARANATLHAISDAVLRLDNDLQLRYLNRQAESFTGCRLDDVHGGGLERLHALGNDVISALAALARRCRDGASPLRQAGHVVMPAGPDGAARALHLSASPLLDAAGRADGVVLVLNDVSDTVDAAQQLAHQATHDALTGLPNRVLLRDRLRQALAQRAPGIVAVLFVDLDRFKRINDSLGHQTGDRVLTTLAGRLRSVCRIGDTVARWGGDEFMIILQDMADREAVGRVAAKVMHAVGETITLDDVDFRFSCSIGIAIAHEDSSDADVLFSMADTAMYRSKSQSGAAIHFYACDMSAGTRDWIELESDLRRGIEEDRFEVHYQPQYEMAGGRLSAFEALLRFRRLDGELLQPADFITVAEESGLIESIGDWVLQEVTLQIANWSSQGLPVVPVAVNVSARQCLGRSLVRRVANALEQSGIMPSLLRLELTETTAMSDVDHVAALLGDIRALGVSLSVDDFGTGYSSLSYLKRFPIDELKVDRSFVRDLCSDADDEAIVRATIALAHGLGMRVVAEGVETEAQLAMLSAHHCDVVQGYLFSRPLSAADLAAQNILAGGKVRTERGLRLIQS